LEKLAMLWKIGRSAVGGLFLVLLTGCIEQTQIVTINPDGRGKIQYEIVMPGDSPLTSGPGGGKEKTLDEMLKAAGARMVSRKGITAWKDVTVKWEPDGRFHFVGTAYFERLGDLWDKQKNDVNFEQFDISIDKESGMKLTLRKSLNPGAPKKPRPDFAKMTDKEMDDYVLMQRIKYQTGKGIMIAFLTDLHIKTVFRLPGNVQEAKGFKKNAANAATRELDGTKLLAAINKVMAKNNTELKKLIKKSKEGDLVEVVAAEFLGTAHVTVPKLTAPLFDYDAEVAAARKAYPELRKQLNISPNVKLPGE
jgi:hypothetical protein